MVGRVQSTQRGSEGAAGAATPLTARVFLLSLLLIPFNAWWLTEIEYVRYSDNATTQAIFFNAVSLLLALLGINKLLRRFWPRAVFSPQELVALYVMIAVASNLAGHDVLQILFTTLTFVYHHAGPSNGWDTKIIPYLPRSLMPQDRDAINALYTGSSTLYRWDHILPWIKPLGLWSLFTIMLVWTMLCLVALFRRQWDYERLAYPIAEIPIQVIQGSTTLFRSPALWIGFAIGAGCDAVNLIHALAPSFPGAPIGVQYYHLDSFPWSAAGSLPISSFPFAYGLTFLLPTQLGFSVWFFFLLSRIELVGAAIIGYSEWGKFPYVQQQGVGAILGVFLSIVYAARGHLAQSWHSAWRPPPRKDESTGNGPADPGDPYRGALLPQDWAPGSGAGESDEPLSYRTAIWGGMAGMVGMICFAMAAGMRFYTAVLYLAILFMIVVVVARLRAELGLPTYELYQVGADQVLQRVAGTHSWSRGDLIGMSLFFWLSRTHRQFPMQTQVDAVRLGHRTNTPLRSLSALILWASLLGTLAAFWAFLHTMYQVGYESARFQGPAIWAFGNEPWQKFTQWTASPTQPDAGTLGAYVFGVAFTLFLAAMRARFLWWPFHPVGYLVSGSFGLFRLWLPIFASWLVKVLILRYGGLHGYRRALPFFIGLVLGEFSAGFLRTLIDLFFGLHLPAASGIGGL